MKCEHCKQNQATCFYQINTNGTVRSYSLCADCAAKLQLEGFDATSPFGTFETEVNNLFSGLFASPTKSTPKVDKSCPGCGARWRELATEGKVFCSQCYNTFREELEPTIRSLHGNTAHTGHAPLQTREMREKDARLAALKQEMSVAIAEENFEKAAILRDEIRALEKE